MTYLQFFNMNRLISSQPLLRLFDKLLIIFIISISDVGFIKIVSLFSLILFIFSVIVLLGLSQ